MCSTLGESYLRFNVNNHRSLLYKLSVIGPVDPSFKKAVSALRRIYAFFEESFAEGVMRPHVGHVVGTLDGILAQTRFITPSAYSVFHEAPVSQQFDPDHVLAGLVDTGHFKFTEDNVVSFFQIISEHDGYVLCVDLLLYTMTYLMFRKLRKVEVEPSIFRRGHLVEASLCFRSIATGSSQVFLTRLDSIMLLS
jgi:hypothetical protein